MLSTVLRSETAIRMSIHIMDAFVAMRRFYQAQDMLNYNLTVATTKLQFAIRRLQPPNYKTIKIIYRTFASGLSTGQELLPLQGVWGKTCERM